uniref:Uncharacterized protein MANES_10G141000 n=1 Tax=Rhizophora mucronata TaxID=61149 RepID=A0A2P2JL89_RHIMU
MDMQGFASVISAVASYKTCNTFPEFPTEFDVRELFELTASEVIGTFTSTQSSSLVVSLHPLCCFPSDGSSVNPLKCVKIVSSVSGAHNTSSPLAAMPQRTVHRYSLPLCISGA